MLEGFNELRERIRILIDQEISLLRRDIKSLERVHIGDTVSVPGDLAAPALPGWALLLLLAVGPTLGGYGLGKMIDKPRVLGAATDDALVEATETVTVTLTGVTGGTQTIPIDQKLAPDDLTWNGGVWEHLGQFQISGGTLTVQLTDNANGYVYADAIRLEYLHALGSDPADSESVVRCLPTATSPPPAAR